MPNWVAYLKVRMGDVDGIVSSGTGFCKNCGDYTTRFIIEKLISENPDQYEKICSSSKGEFDDAEVKYKTIKLKASKIDFNPELSLKFRFFRYPKGSKFFQEDKWFGYNIVTLKKIKDQKEFNMRQPTGMIIPGGFTAEVELKEKPTFITYIQQGWTINLSIGIDYGAVSSNSHLMQDGNQSE